MILSEPFGVEDPNLPPPPYPPSSRSSAAGSSKYKKRDIGDKNDKDDDSSQSDMSLSDSDQKGWSSDGDLKKAPPSLATPSAGPCCHCQCHEHAPRHKGFRWNRRKMGRRYRHLSSDEEENDDDTDESKDNEELQKSRCGRWRLRRRQRSRKHPVLACVLLLSLAYFLVTQAALQQTVLTIAHRLGDHAPAFIVKAFNTALATVLSFFGDSPILVAWLFVSSLLFVSARLVRRLHRAAKLRRRRKWRARRDKLMRWSRALFDRDLGEDPSLSSADGTSSGMDSESVRLGDEQKLNGAMLSRSSDSWLRKVIESIRRHYANFPVGMARYQIVLTKDLEGQDEDVTLAYHSRAIEKKFDTDQKLVDTA